MLGLPMIYLVPPKTRTNVEVKKFALTSGGKYEKYPPFPTMPTQRLFKGLLKISNTSN